MEILNIVKILYVQKNGHFVLIIAFTLSLPNDRINSPIAPSMTLYHIALLIFLVTTIPLAASSAICFSSLSLPILRWYGATSAAVFESIS